jgi:hypothetical protein
MGAIYPRISGAANVVARAARRFAGAKADLSAATAAVHRSAAVTKSNHFLEIVL